MTPAEAQEKRTQMERDGFCVIDDILSDDFLQELRVETEALMEDWVMPIDFKYQGQHVTTRGEDNATIQKLLDWPPTRCALEAMDYGDFTSTGGIILLTKDPGEPALYWHQDWMQWNDPLSTSPWPQIIFVSYYLQDTSIENGCLKVIPGTHRRRIDLHDILPKAHEPEIQAIDDLGHDVFMDRADAVDVPLTAGDLVIADCRLLHGAWPNQTDQRRTLTLAWHDCLSFPEPPSWWAGDVPEVVKNADPSATYETTRTPSPYLGAV